MTNSRHTYLSQAIIFYDMIRPTFLLGNTMKDSPSLASENSSGRLEITTIFKIDKATPSSTNALQINSSDECSSDSSDAIKSHKYSADSSDTFESRSSDKPPLQPQKYNSGLSDTEEMPSESETETARKRKLAAIARSISIPLRKKPRIVDTTSQSSLYVFLPQQKDISKKDGKAKEEICNSQPLSPGQNMRKP